MIKYEEPSMMFFTLNDEDVITSSLEPGKDGGEGMDFPLSGVPSV